VLYDVVVLGLMLLLYLSKKRYDMIEFRVPRDVEREKRERERPPPPQKKRGNEYRI